MRLLAQGVQRGDRVVIYMPLVPEIVVAMHACARIGAIHSVVFGGFSAPSLKDRIEDAGAKVLITADGGWRGGHVIELKAAVDKALAAGCRTIERVIVYKRTGEAVSMKAERDVWWHDVVEGQSPVCEPVWVDAEHPLFLLYTSGSTGKPKGIQHSSAGYLLGVKTTSQWVFDLREDDVFWCTADVGWVTGHSYVAYGPLAAGATVVMYEGAPTVPDGGRFWKICQDHRVTIFYTAPTAIRALMKLGDEIPAKYNLSKLRLLGSVGEPINPEAWIWYQQTIGGGRCPIVDTWWQTETGAHHDFTRAERDGDQARLVHASAAGNRLRTSSTTRASRVSRADAGGYLVIRKPWPSMLRTIWGDNARYVSTYWEKFQNRYYVAGDSAHRDEDGYFWIMGRIDDVLNVAGHRLGTMEIESALVSHPRVAEAAVVGKPHDIKGESVFAYVVCRGARPTATPRGSRRSCATGLRRSWAPSRSPTTSASPTTCRRPAPARSCAASCAPSRAATRSRRTSPHSRIPGSSTSSAASTAPAPVPPRLRQRSREAESVSARKAMRQKSKRKEASPRTETYRAREADRQAQARKAEIQVPPSA